MIRIALGPFRGRRGGRLLCVATVLALAIALPAWGSPGAMAAAPEIVAVATATAGRVLVPVELRGVDTGALRPESFVVELDGAPQPTTAEPVLSDRTAVAIVVDASDPALPALQSGLSGAAELVLSLPPSIRSALIVDRTPPVVVSALQPRSPEILRAMAAIRAGGQRQTTAALELAVGQLPAEPTAPRIVLLHTSAPDAGGEPAAALAGRLRTAGVLLAVISTGGREPVAPYWATVAAGTGGLVIDAAPGQSVAAFEQLDSALRRRYLLTVPAPAQLPAAAVVRVDTVAGPLRTTAPLRAPSGPGAPSPLPESEAATNTGGQAGITAVALGAAAVVFVSMIGTLVLRYRRGREPGWQRLAAAVRAPRPAAAAPVWNLPGRPSVVVARERLLDELDAAVTSRGRAVLRTERDRAGVGTTTLMIDFAHRRRASYDIAWRVVAADPDLIPDQLAALAEEVGLVRPGEAAQAATTKLLAELHERDRWLLIFDDVENPRDVERFLPFGPGHLLIATADPGQPGDAAVAVDRFSRAESVTLLRARRPELAATAASMIAQALEDLPLAVGPVAATLADAEISAHTFLRVLADRRAGGDNPGVLAATWAVVLDQLTADDPAAAELLTLVAWLGPGPVPLALITAAADLLPAPLADVARSPSELGGRAALLGRRDLATVTADSVALHRAAAGVLVARTGGSRPVGGTGWAAIAVRLLARLPERLAADHTAWRGLLPHVLAATDPARPLEEVEQDVGRLLGQAAGYLQERGQPRAARALFEDAYELRRRRLGADHPDTVATARQLAADLRTLGEHDQARRILGADQLAHRPH